MALALLALTGTVTWRLGERTAWAEIDALLKSRLEGYDDDTAAVLESARDVINSAARRPYALVLTHFWLRMANWARLRR